MRRKIKIFPIDYRVLAVCVLCLAWDGGHIAWSIKPPAPAKPAFPAPTHDAFSGTRFATTDEFIAQLKRDPQMRKRYTKHFGVTEDELVEVFARTLVPTTLPTDKTLEVYGITKKGVIYRRKVRLKAGTRVFTTASGKVVLKWSCGNPVVERLPYQSGTPRTVKNVRSNSGSMDDLVSNSGSSGYAGGVPPVGYGSTMDESLAFIAPSPVDFISQANDALLPPPVQDILAPQLPLGGAAGNLVRPALAAVSIGGIGSWLGAHTGGSNSTTPPTNSGGNGGGTNGGGGGGTTGGGGGGTTGVPGTWYGTFPGGSAVAPEPSTFALFATGPVIFALARRRRKTA